jgi:hypothetical protein
MAATPEAKSYFVLIIQGSLPWAGVVEGIEGVRAALMRILWTDPEPALIKDVAAAIASLDDPAAWLPHGSGDGRPYWHWWLGYEGGSITVQRLTEPLLSDTAMSRLSATFSEVTDMLTDFAEDLRKLTDVEQRQYVFTRRQPTQRVN